MLATLATNELDLTHPLFGVNSSKILMICLHATMTTFDLPWGWGALFLAARRCNSGTGTVL